MRPTRSEIQEMILLYLKNWISGSYTTTLIVIDNKNKDMARICM